MVDHFDPAPFSHPRSLGQPLKTIPNNIKLPQGYFKKYAIRQLDLLGNPQDSQHFQEKSLITLLGKVPSELLYFIGLDSAQQLKLILDKDFDGDFGNEETYPLSKPTNANQISAETFSVVHLTLGSEKRNITFDLRVIPKWHFPNLKISTGDAFLDTTLVAFESIKYKYGTFFDGAKQIHIYLNNSGPSLRYNDKRFVEILMSDTLITENHSESQSTIMIGDEVSIDSSLYRINYVSILGDSIQITKLPHVETKSNIEKMISNKLDLMTGHRILLKEISKKYILIDFWGTWCGPCVAQSEGLKSMYNSKIVPVKDSLKLISVALDRSDTKVIDYLKRNDIRWINLFESMNNPDNQELVRFFKVVTFPTFILINPQGKVIHRQEGETGLQVIRKWITEKFY